MPAAEVGTHAYVNPVVAVALGALAGGESVSPAQIAGLALILAGVAMATMPLSQNLSKRAGK